MFSERLGSLEQNELWRVLSRKRAAGDDVFDLTESNPTRVGLAYPSDEIQNVVTRVGDTFMALGLFLVFRELGTIEIQASLVAAEASWPEGSTVCTIIALLLLGGAVGKSAQVPLQTWLPDAMAGPTRVTTNALRAA